jgi:DnaJ homolog subfamily C member 28
MRKIDKAVEQIIEQAIREGKFKDLKGEGEPLNITKNPHVEEGWQLAFDMMKGNGFAPAWVETRNAIENQLRLAREKYARTWKWSQEIDVASSEWSQATIDNELAKANKLIESQIEDINKKIKLYNLETPSDKFQRLPVSLEKELLKIIK